ncbi:MAG: hypothetical protein PCFJNLEI_01987 [Verrucomicrobiae bacterium]|nr:hypothetical protein [Verrucomicrobiae bacterium]
MICKDKNPDEHRERDKFSEAGNKAEEQMAFYLKRAFRDDPDLWVFHDLRFRSDDDDVCQIDHLVMHRSGFIVIESKSVTSKVRVHANGEWERLWNNHWQGMPSPIKQAERQIEFLRAAFQAYREQLLGKTLLGTMQMGFRNMPMEVLVAISDTGSIQREGDSAQVTKADLITDRIREIVARHKKARALFSLNLDFKSMDGAYNFKDEEVEAMRRWLIEHHYPKSLEQERKTQPPNIVAETPATYAPPPIPQAAAPLPSAMSSVPTAGIGLGKCAHCGGQSSILWGRYGYYWKCGKCDKNMPIKDTCPSCQEKVRLRKDKLRFYKYCEKCKTPETLYYDGA